jgi:hypothetical protein
MPKPNVSLAPIDFTAEEVLQARAGNFEPIEKRLKKNLASRAPFAGIVGRPRSAADLKNLIRKSRG